MPSRDLASQAPAQLAVKTRSATPAVTVSSNRLSQPATSALSGRYLQVGAFEDLHNAEELRRALAAASLQDQVAINPLENNGKTLYRVWVGPIKDEAANDNVVYNLTRLGIGQRPVVTP
jgi:cell division protein FtsN